MFEQQKYINNYIKNNYKTLKIRIRNDEKIIINKINKVDNITQYIKDLIMSDIISNCEYNYINNNIKIDFELTNTMADLINKAEEADMLNDYGLYMNLVDAIDSQAKKETNKHIISESEWKSLLRRYQL